MSTLETAVRTFRRGWRISKTFIFAGAFAAAFVAGVFADFATDPSSRLLPLVLFGLWILVFGFKAASRFAVTTELQVKRDGRSELELGLLLVVATHAVVQMAGGLSSPLYPLVFVLIAFLVVYTRQWVGFALVAAAIGIEYLLVFVGAAETAKPFEVLLHSIFIIFFALINLVFTRTEVARMRRRSQRHMEAVKAAIQSDARDFRLTASASGHVGGISREEESARLSVSTVGEVRRSMYHHVDLLKRTMELHTCLILWLDVRGETLRILECISDTESVTSRSIQKGAGVLGAILQHGKPIRLSSLRPRFGSLPYYDETEPVTSFVGVPVFECGNLRGILCADRIGGRDFTEMEVETLMASVESILRIISNERVFMQLQKAKSEQSKLLAASDALAHVLGEEEVVEAALKAAGQIASYDIAVVALLESNGRQVVRKAIGQRGEELEGTMITASGSLAASALRSRHFLPYRGDLDPKQQVVLSKKTQQFFRKMRSALILPLVAGDEPLGTLTLASTAEMAYGEEVRTTLQVMTNQLGIGLQNARMVRRLEEMATIDGLTGLANRRVFQEELDKKLASATRFHKDLSVILCDVDKFKGVNDTYGHGVGDMVLRELGKTLRRNVVRDTDLPARFGGEEFVILCEGTSTEGAVKLAERIRKDLERQIFPTEKGDLRVTISMGVATFPTHAHDREALVSRADTALYAAKNGGRNQVITWRGGMAAKEP